MNAYPTSPYKVLYFSTKPFSPVSRVPSTSDLRDEVCLAALRPQEDSCLLYARFVKTTDPYHHLTGRIYFGNESSVDHLMSLDEAAATTDFVKMAWMEEKEVGITKIFKAPSGDLCHFRDNDIIVAKQGDQWVQTYPNPGMDIGQPG